MVKFILIRHGEATHNVGAETEGDAAYENPAYRNSHLTEKGVNQAADAINIAAFLGVLTIICVRALPIVHQREWATVFFCCCKH